jgi:hypothetical protein
VEKEHKEIGQGEKDKEKKDAEKKDKEEKDNEKVAAKDKQCKFGSFD